MLAGKGINRAEDGIIRAGYGSKGILIKKSSKNKNFHFPSIFWLILKYKRVIIMYLDLMEFILEIIYLVK